MAEINTDSYPRPQLPVNTLDVAGKLGGLQQQSLAINQQKLDQANQALGYMTRAMASIGPDGTKDQYLAVGQNAVKMGLVPPQMLNTYAERLNAAPTPQAFYNEFVNAAATHQETLDYHLGRPGTMQNGQTIQPTMTSQKPGFGVRSVGAPIQMQIPPTSQGVGPNGQPAFVAAQAPDIAPGSGAVAAPPPVNSLPVSQPRSVAPMPAGHSNNFGGSILSVQPPPDVSFTQPAANKDQGRMVPRGPATGLPPMADQGMKQLAADQDLATQKMTAIKPLLLALPKMKDLRSGPGTETYNTAVAFLKANGILPIDATNDPTVVYQEVNKYMNQYISRNGSRSDAELASKESSNPNVKTQINPALLELTKNTIAQDRVEAARPNSFEGTDYSKYGQHRSTFPQTMSLEAAKLDTLEPEERITKFNDMLAKAKKGDKNAIKFIKTLDVMRKQNMHDLSQ